MTYVAERHIANWGGGVSAFQIAELKRGAQRDVLDDPELRAEIFSGPVVLVGRTELKNEGYTATAMVTPIPVSTYVEQLAATWLSERVGWKTDEMAMANFAAWIREKVENED